MQSPNWISSTKEAADSSVGVSPTAFIPLWTLNPFNELLYLTTGSSSFPIFREEKSEDIYIINPSFRQGTVGDQEASKFFEPLHTIDLTLSARRKIKSFVNTNLANYADSLLLVLRNHLDEFDYFDEMPIICANEGDDGSILIEWIFPLLRIGFSIEPAFQESSWALVSKKEAGGIHASGYLEGANLDALFKWLIGFVSFTRGSGNG